jgi:hypothetical protein
MTETGTAPWIGVDLDGTLAHYEGWQGIEHVGKPIPAMVHLVKTLLAHGQNVKIFTARVCGTCDCKTPEAHEESCRVREVRRARKYIDAWVIDNIGIRLEVTNVKDFGMLYCIDDRNVTCEMNTGRLLTPLPELT